MPDVAISFFLSHIRNCILSNCKITHLKTHKEYPITTIICYL